MDTPILTLNQLGMILIFGLLAILLFYGIILLKNLVATVKHTNKILEDAQVVSKITADRAKEVDKAVSDAVSAVSGISDSIKGNQSIWSALATVINTIAALNKIFKK